MSQRLGVHRTMMTGTWTYELKQPFFKIALSVHIVTEIGKVTSFMQGPAMGPMQHKCSVV